MRKFVLLLVTLAVLGMSTLGYASAYQDELHAAEQHELTSGQHDEAKSSHGSSHSCHIGAHMIALPSAGVLSLAPPSIQTRISTSIDSPPLVFLDLPLRPPRTAA